MHHVSKWLIGGFIAVLLGGIVGGTLTYRLTRPTEETRPVISAQTILQALKPQGFLVTQSIITNQEVTIDRSTGNVFRDFFLGQTITARGTMEANLGIDLTELTENDIELTEERITVHIPDVRLFNTRLIGEIEVENSQGIIKRLFQPDDGYNESLQSLTAATESLAGDTHVISSARERSKEELRRLVRLLQTDTREVVIEFEN